MYDHTAVQPTRTHISFDTRTENPYFERELIYYVLRDAVSKKIKRIVSGYGSRPSSDWSYGSIVRLHHDQAGYYMGTYVVAGWFSDHFYSGEIPAHKLPLSVLK